MKKSAQAPKDWREWLNLFSSIYCTQGLIDLIDVLGVDDAQKGMSLIAAYMIPVQTSMCTTLLAACLQNPPDHLRESTLTTIVKMIADAHFEKSPRGLKPKAMKKYQEVIQEVARVAAPTSKIVAAVMKCYAKDDYDLARDINVDIRQANALLKARKRSEAYQIVCRCGAAALRGANLWDGWLNESDGEFELWMLALSSMRNALLGVIPLLPYAEQRTNAKGTFSVDNLLSAQTERLNAKGTFSGTTVDQAVDSSQPEETANTDGSAEYFRHLDDMVNATSRDDPLTDDEIKALGNRYELYGEMATQALTVIQFAPDEDETTDIVYLFVKALGVLRYPDHNAIMQLILISSGTNDFADDEAIDAAIEALKQIGSPALPHVFDFVRYSSLEDARRDMLEVLGVVGRGSAEVFDYLTKQFVESSWLEDKYDYVKALGLTHDPRAVPLIIDALRDPSIDEDIAWELLDALQELEVTFYINPDSRSVNIPEFGVIEDVLPVDWHSRKEIEEDEDDEWDEEWEDLNPDNSAEEEDDDDELLDDLVVYDEDGTPRCPDCGAEMHFIDGAWVHEDDVDKPDSTQPKIKPVGRNDPCPCGSGRKYKYCHGRAA